jgi:hypothetical protein
MIKKSYAFLCQFLMLTTSVLVSQPTAVAQPSGRAADTPATSEAGAQDDDGWQVRAIPYLWFSGLNGDVVVGERTIPVDLSFGDIFDATDSLLAFEGYFDARKDKWGFFGDVMLIKLGVEGIAFEGGPIDLTNRLNVLEFGGLYRLSESPAAAERESAVDLVFGLRSSFLDVRTRLNEIEGVTGPRDLTENNQKWAEPFVGMRGETALGKRASFVAEGNVGGFGAGSDFSWKALGAVSFHVSKSVSILGGYRALGQDYESGDDSFKWDMVIHGPIVGFGFTF